MYPHMQNREGGERGREREKEGERGRGERERKRERDHTVLTSILATQGRAALLMQRRREGMSTTIDCLAA